MPRNHETQEEEKLLVMLFFSAAVKIKSSKKYVMKRNFAKYLKILILKFRYDKIL